MLRAFMPLFGSSWSSIARSCVAFEMACLALGGCEKASRAADRAPAVSTSTSEQRVHNLEIAGTHVYSLGRLRNMAHNTSASRLPVTLSPRFHTLEEALSRASDLASSLELNPNNFSFVTEAMLEDIARRRKLEIRSSTHTEPLSMTALSALSRGTYVVASELSPADIVVIWVPGVAEINIFNQQWSAEKNQTLQDTFGNALATESSHPVVTVAPTGIPSVLTPAKTFRGETTTYEPLRIVPNGPSPSTISQISVTSMIHLHEPSEVWVVHVHFPDPNQNGAGAISSHFDPSQRSLKAKFTRWIRWFSR